MPSSKRLASAFPRLSSAPFAGFVAALTMLSSGCHDDHDHDDDEGRLGRLLVADGDVGQLRVVDLDDGDVIATYDIAEPASVYAGRGRRWGYAFQPNEGLVQIVDGAVWLVEHGDHDDVYIEEPRLLDFSIEGVRPTHLTQFGTRAAIFFDGSQPDGSNPEVPARTVVITEATLLETPDVFEFEDADAHHGVAVPLLDGLLVSTDAAPADGSNPLPRGVQFAGWDGEVDDLFEGVCEGLHGEATLSNNRVAFGCVDGILIVERESHLESWSTRKLDYPTDDGRRSGTLRAESHEGLLVGNYQNEAQPALVGFDVETGEATELQFDHPVVAFYFAEGHDHPLVVLTADGTLHIVDAEEMEIEASIPVVDPFTPSWTEPRPKVAVAYEVAYVSDPATGYIYEIDLDHAEVERSFHVGGTPNSLVVLGPGSPLDDHHDHGH